MSMPIDSQVETSDPKMQSVSYRTILPEGKTSDYSPGQRIDYKINSTENPYFDGSKSYLLLKVESRCQFAEASATAPVPVCFPANMGANVLVNRLVARVNDGTGRIVEDREAYNMWNGIQNAYTHDSDVFPSLAKVTGVSGRNTNEINQTCDNIGNQYFVPNATITSNVATGGPILIDNSFVIPVELGIFSTFRDQHFAVPNFDLNGLHLTYHLETGNRSMQLLCHRFFQEETINTVAQQVVVKAVNPLVPLACTFTANDVFTIDQSACDPNLYVDGESWTLDNLAWRIGMPLTSISAGLTAIINRIEIDAGLVKITTTGNLVAGTGPDTIRLGDVSKRSYNISKCELRILNTTPDASTMKQIRRSLQRGLNFNSTALYKVSTAAQLVNAVCDIPEALTRCLSIIAVPVQQSKLTTLDQDNAYIYPRPDSVFQSPTNPNDYSYQWLVRNVLIPNLQVETNHLVDAKSDNCILFQQQIMALRPMMEVRSLGDKIINDKIFDLDLPFFFPLLLAPHGSSFDLIDSAPQLRIENSQSSNLAQITAKLHFMFVTHVRKLTVVDDNVEINF